jgi:tetratricopeptide (TPR) repeat protein
MTKLFFYKTLFLLGVNIIFRTFSFSQSNDFIRAEALFQLENYKEAAEIFNSLDSRKPWFKKRLVEVNWNAGNYKKAYKLISELRSLDQGFGYFYATRYYTKKRKADSAFIMLEKMLEARYKPNRSSVKTDSVLKELKNYPQWDSIWKLKHYNEYDLKVEMAAQELSVKNYDLALQLLDELIEDRAYKDKPWFLRSKLLYEQGFYKTSLEDIDKAIKEQEREAIYYYHRAEVFMKLDKPKKAFKDALKAIEIADYDPRWYEIATQAIIAIEKFEDASFYSKTYLEAMPEKDNAHFFYATIIYNTGSCMKALPHINKAIALEDRNPDYYFLRAQIYQSCKVYKQAIKDYNMCLDFWPRKAEIYLGRGICRHELGETKQSCRDLWKAYDLGSLKADDLRREWCK